MAQHSRGHGPDHYRPAVLRELRKAHHQVAQTLFRDSGLACHLLGIETEQTLSRSPFPGPLFEGFVASEIAKQQLGAGRPRELYYFRDQQGLEVDLLVPSGHRGLMLIEAKASRTATPAMAGSMSRLAQAIREFRVQRFVVHRPTREVRHLSVLGPDFKAVALDGLLGILPGSRAAHSNRR